MTRILAQYTLNGQRFGVVDLTALFPLFYAGPLDARGERTSRARWREYRSVEGARLALKAEVTAVQFVFMEYLQGGG